MPYRIGNVEVKGSEPETSVVLAFTRKDGGRSRIMRRRERLGLSAPAAEPVAADSLVMLRADVDTAPCEVNTDSAHDRH
jgi:hypothetical protein